MKITKSDYVAIATVLAAFWVFLGHNIDQKSLPCVPCTFYMSQGTKFESTGGLTGTF